MSNGERRQLRFDDASESRRVLSSEDPLEAIYGPTGSLSNWEESRLLADQRRIDQEYRIEHRWPRRRVLKQMGTSQLRLPDIFRQPVPARVEQFRMFSDLEVRKIGEPRISPTGMPMEKQDRMQDVIDGNEWRRGT